MSLKKNRGSRVLEAWSDLILITLPPLIYRRGVAEGIILPSYRR